MATPSATCTWLDESCMPRRMSSQSGLLVVAAGFAAHSLRRTLSIYDDAILASTRFRNMLTTHVCISGKCAARKCSHYIRMRGLTPLKRTKCVLHRFAIYAPGKDTI